MAKSPLKIAEARRDAVTEAIAKSEQIIETERQNVEILKRKKVEISNTITALSEYSEEIGIEELLERERNNPAGGARTGRTGNPSDEALFSEVHAVLHENGDAMKGQAIYSALVERGMNFVAVDEEQYLISRLYKMGRDGLLEASSGKFWVADLVGKKPETETENSEVEGVNESAETEDETA